MNAEECFVGIDVSKAELEVGLIPEEKTWNTSNDHGGIGELVEELSASHPNWWSWRPLEDWRRLWRGLLPQPIFP